MIIHKHKFEIMCKLKTFFIFVSFKKSKMKRCRYSVHDKIMIESNSNVNQVYEYKAGAS